MPTAYNPRMTPTQYTDLASVLARLGYPESAAHYHGTLCGVLCRLLPEEVDPVRLLGAELVTAYDADARRTLAWTRDQALDALADTGEQFAPLLPGDEVPLRDRARALAQWCDGFLYGLSSERKLVLEDCSDEVREALSDFADFTRAGVQSVEDLDSEEEAYTQIIDYLCVSTRLLYWQLHPRQATTRVPHRLH